MIPLPTSERNDEPHSRDGRYKSWQTFWHKPVLFDGQHVDLALYTNFTRLYFDRRGLTFSILYAKNIVHDNTIVCTAFIAYIVPFLLRREEVKSLQSKSDIDSIPVLSEDIPVTMPDLPVYIVINNVQQLKAISDHIRSRILGIIQNQPATAKQIADSLQASPGAIGHHLHVLEAA